MAPIGKDAAIVLKPLKGPQINVEATLDANLCDARRTLRAIQEYIEDVARVSATMKDIALMNSNMPAYTSAQSTIDVTKDVKDLLDGKRIVTIREMEAEHKKKMEDKAAEEDRVTKEKEAEAKLEEEKEQQYAY